MGVCISSKKQDVADVVLLTQDDCNSQIIANQILENSYAFHSIRNMHGYTGMFGDMRVSVQGLGIGNVSASMYVTELVREAAPKLFVKVDGCTALKDSLKLGDIILPQTVHTTSRINRHLYAGKTFPAAADFTLLNHFYEMAGEQKRSVFAGPIVSIETRDEMDIAKKFANRGALCIDMEMSQVYTVSNLAAVPALGVLRVFKNEINTEQLSDPERKEQYIDLVNFALQAVSHYLAVESPVTTP